jgi:uncharacterized protein (DUF2141 family)
VIWSTLIFIGALSASPVEGDCNLSVSVEIQSNRPSKGHFVVSLFESKETFLITPVATKVLSLAAKKHVARFDGICSGTYALSGFHDQNSDRKLNTNFLGIPKEAVGFSRGAKSRFGPPEFQAAQFDVSQALTRLSLSLGEAKPAKRKR